MTLQTCAEPYVNIYMTKVAMAEEMVKHISNARYDIFADDILRFNPNEPGVQCN